MDSPPDDDPFTREHQRREAAWDPVVRWQVLQETIAWAESQATVRRNTPEACLRLQKAKLAGLGPQK